MKKAMKLKKRFPLCITEKFLNSAHDCCLLVSNYSTIGTYSIRCPQMETDGQMREPLLVKFLSFWREKTNSMMLGNVTRKVPKEIKA